MKKESLLLISVVGLSLGCHFLTQVWDKVNTQASPPPITTPTTQPPASPSPDPLCPPGYHIHYFNEEPPAAMCVPDVGPTPKPTPKPSPKPLVRRVTLKPMGATLTPGMSLIIACEPRDDKDRVLPNETPDVFYIGAKMGVPGPRFKVTGDGPTLRRLTILPDGVSGDIKSNCGFYGNPGVFSDNAVYHVVYP